MTKYGLSIALTMGIVLGTVGLICWYADPYGYWGRTPFGQYDDNYAPEMKAAFLTRYPHDLTFIGTSKGMRVNPDDFPDCRMYNASINGIRAEQIRHLVLNFVPPDTHVVIGLDFFTFREDGRRADDFGRRTWMDFLKYTLSVEALRQSRKTYKYHKQGEPTHLRRNGARLTLEKPITDYRPDYKSYLDFVETAMFSNFRLSDSRLAMILDVKKFLEARGQRYTFFISPNSRPMFEFLDRLGLTEKYDEFRRRLKEIDPGIYDFTGEYLDPRLYFNKDPHHFYPTTAIGFLGRIIRERGCGSAQRS